MAWVVLLVASSAMAFAFTVDRLGAHTPRNWNMTKGFTSNSQRGLMLHISTLSF
jgi:hypothetical protein